MGTDRPSSEAENGDVPTEDASLPGAARLRIGTRSRGNAGVELRLPRSARPETTRTPDDELLGWVDEDLFLSAPEDRSERTGPESSAPDGAVTLQLSGGSRPDELEAAIGSELAEDISSSSIDDRSAEESGTVLLFLPDDTSGTATRLRPIGTEDELLAECRPSVRTIPEESVARVASAMEIGRGRVEKALERLSATVSGRLLSEVEREPTPAPETIDVEGIQYRIHYFSASARDRLLRLCRLDDDLAGACWYLHDEFAARLVERHTVDDRQTKRPRAEDGGPRLPDDHPLRRRGLGVFVRRETSTEDRHRIDRKSVPPVQPKFVDTISVMLGHDRDELWTALTVVSETIDDSSIDVAGLERPHEPVKTRFQSDHVPPADYDTVLISPLRNGDLQPLIEEETDLDASEAKACAELHKDQAEELLFSDRDDTPEQLREMVRQIDTLITPIRPADVERPESSERPPDRGSADGG